MAVPTFFLFTAVVSAWWLAAAARGRAEEEGGGGGGGGCGRASKKCGELNISFPFWIDQGRQTDRPCGIRDFLVDCNDSNGVATLGSSTRYGFEIMDISYRERTLLVLDSRKVDDLTNSSNCHVPTWNTSAKLGIPFRISPANLNLVLYNCTPAKEPSAAERRELGLVETKCRNNSFARLGGHYYDGRINSDEYSLEGCAATFLPVLLKPGVSANASGYEALMRDGFLMTWEQLQPPAAICVCFKFLKPFVVGENHTPKKIGIAFGTGGGVLVIVIFIFVWYKRKKRRRSRDLKDVMRSGGSSMQSYSKELELGGSPHIFSYEELEEATAGFSASRELGDGGFGTVYRGKLKDGRVVAVKRLHKNNYRRVEQFLNEVDILSRLLHQNLVALYGCTSRCSRDLLLVYEYIPNGTVADHLHGHRAEERGLTWPGTPGYVDPVYHQCYKLTDKSDVYSFGVVLVELISSKPAVDMCRSQGEINLANMALNRIKNHEIGQLVDPELGYETDSETKRMVDQVAELAFQCLQLDRDVRPPIKEVEEVLHCIKDGGECPAKMVRRDASPEEDAQLHLLRYSPDSVIHRFHSQSTSYSVASSASR
ncbi:hypothetical protein GUJ93_ZPchr0008g11718 [Zizania palustris]|uniref:Protein kinase domain-containing protein n=1 Tax=Zizania palustris TaxID=103762 RepID=A0A8J5RJQ6_ZIZPA|nr:hypothetical protein GUJ93_ZPchr0008g11718 [Zizania palustris]